jgi:thiosulfate/3-mercaptopyruvate sulfurtransferase
VELPPFVTATWLAERRAADPDGGPVVVDVRWALDGSQGHHTYLEGHLPGAVYVDLAADLAGPPTPEGGRNPLPSPAHLAEALGRRGIPDDAEVVAYDTARGAVAARLVWSLRVLGQPAAVLSGGLATWDGPLERGEVTLSAVMRTVVPWPEDRLAEVDEVAALADDPGSVHLDVRAPERFRGDLETVDARAGHIPGARNLPVAAQVDDTGRLLAPDELAARYAAVGVDRDTPVVASCGSGVSACFALLALETLDRDGRLFPGSWSAWSSDPDRPVATGEG